MRASKITSSRSIQKEYYEVQSIIGRKGGVKKLYLVKWKGFPQSQSTWQTKTDLQFVKQMVEEYDKKYPEPLSDTQNCRISKSTKKEKKKYESLMLGNLSLQEEVNIQQNQRSVQSAIFKLESKGNTNWIKKQPIKNMIQRQSQQKEISELTIFQPILQCKIKSKACETAIQNITKSSIKQSEINSIFENLSYNQKKLTQTKKNKLKEQRKQPSGKKKQLKDKIADKKIKQENIKKKNKVQKIANMSLSEKNVISLSETSVKQERNHENNDNLLQFQQNKLLISTEEKELIDKAINRSNPQSITQVKHQHQIKNIRMLIPINKVQQDQEYLITYRNNSMEIKRTIEMVTLHPVQLVDYLERVAINRS